MSSFLEYFTTDPQKVNQHYSFVGTHTKTPIKPTNEIFLDEGTAINALETHMGSNRMIAFTANFYEDGNKITSPKIEALKAKKLALQTTHREVEIAGLEKATGFTQKTCPCCQRKIYMDRFESIIKSLKSMHVSHGLSYRLCDRSRSHGENHFPFTKADFKKMNSLKEKINNIAEQITQEQLKLAAKKAKKGELKVQALVAAYLHESLYEEYREDY